LSYSAIVLVTRTSRVDPATSNSRVCVFSVTSLSSYPLSSSAASATVAVPAVNSAGSPVATSSAVQPASPASAAPRRR